jgi:glutamate synthase (NADPH/NADH) small chain
VVQATTSPLTQQTKSLYGEVIPDQIKGHGQRCYRHYGGILVRSGGNVQQTGAKIGNEFEIMPKPPVEEAKPRLGLSGLCS